MVGCSDDRDVCVEVWRLFTGCVFWRSTIVLARAIPIYNSPMMEEKQKG